MNITIPALDFLPVEHVLGMDRPESWRHERSQWVFEAEGQTPTAFTWLAPSFQVRVPRGHALRIQSAVKRASGWTDMLDSGWAGDHRALPKRQLKTSGAHIDIDCLMSARPTRDWRLRLSTRGPSPWKWRWGLAVVTWRGAGKHGRWQRVPESLKRTTSIQVPRASQMAEGGKEGWQACSPTTVQMLMAHRGVEVPVPKVMRAAWDPIAKIFGNWQSATQAAWAHGCPGLLVFFRHWDQVLECLRLGIPVAASIKFPKGKVDLPGAPVEHSNGHLLVIRGLTPGGEVLTNDPAAKARDGVPHRYPLGPFSRAWFGFSGMGYLIFPKSG